ncbi:MAG: NAD(P)-dependent alcohol dehydrogenase [Coriobacteriales bacterium]|jgi:aryl-alcohol dehydrogenase|nr:NAD(P)-dependent alcohol dehydrogenase [Coriobacteriales bacterium]
MKATAAVTHETGKLSIEEVELAPPRASEALVRLVATGVCHTDSAGIQQYIPVALPAIFGHEGVGVVEEVGLGVQTLKPGDRVIMTYPSCGTCDYCVSGHPWACDQLNTLFFDGTFKDGTKRFSQNGVEISSFFGQGSFSTHVVVDARNAVKVDVDSDEELARLCSLGCGVQTGAGAVLNGIRPEPGTSLAVFGCGGVGMAALMAAKLAGCYPIIAVDVVPSRLELALELGATHAVNGREGDAVAEIKAITGKGAHASVESSGVPALTLQALRCLRRLGTCCVVSVTGTDTVDFEIEALVMNPSVTFMGLTEGGSNPQVFIPELVKFYRQGKLPIDRLIEFYDFRDIEQAFADSHSGKTIKPILRFAK